MTILPDIYPCKPDIFAKTYDAAIEDTLQPHPKVCALVLLAVGS